MLARPVWMEAALWPGRKNTKNGAFRLSITVRSVTITEDARIAPFSTLKTATREVVKMTEKELRVIKECIRAAQNSIRELACENYPLGEFCDPDIKDMYYHLNDMCRLY